MKRKGTLINSSIKRFCINSKVEKTSTNTRPKKELNDNKTVMPKNKMRCKAVSLLKLSKLSEEYCMRIEAALYSRYKNTSSKEYKTKLRTLKFNLGKNEDLRIRLENDDLEPSKLLDMSSSELMDKFTKEKRTKAQEDIFNESRSDWLDQNRDKMNKVAGIHSETGLFKCYRCKSTKTTHYQKQTRSADEPMTVFVQCTSCGNRWRC